MELADSPFGKLQVYVFNASNRPLNYVLMYTDYPAVFDTPNSIKGCFDAVRDYQISKSNSSLISEKDFLFDKYPGREWKAKTPMVVMWSRQYLIQQRFYNLLVI